MHFWDHQNQDKIVVIVHKALTRAVEKRKYKTKEVWQSGNKNEKYDLDKY